MKSWSVHTGIFALAVLVNGCSALNKHSKTDGREALLKKMIVVFTDQTPSSLVTVAAEAPLNFQLERAPGRRSLESYTGKNSNGTLEISLVAENRSKGAAFLREIDKNECIEEAWVLKEFPDAEKSVVIFDHGSVSSPMVFIQKKSVEIRIMFQAGNTGSRCVSSVVMDSERMMYPTRHPLGPAVSLPKK